jgi:hypothetical protein
VSSKNNNRKKPNKANASKKVAPPTKTPPPIQTQNLSSILKEHPVFVIVSLAASALVAIATVLPAAGYVQEKWKDTTATIDFSGDIDQNKPFALPLVIKNPSSIFWIHAPFVGRAEALRTSLPIDEC